MLHTDFMVVWNVWLFWGVCTLCTVVCVSTLRDLKSSLEPLQGAHLVFPGLTFLGVLVGSAALCGTVGMWSFAVSWFGGLWSLARGFHAAAVCLQFVCLLLARGSGAVDVGVSVALAFLLVLVALLVQLMLYRGVQGCTDAPHRVFRDFLVLLTSLSTRLDNNRLVLLVTVRVNFFKSIVAVNNSGFNTFKCRFYPICYRLMCTPTHENTRYENCSLNVLFSFV